jgi:crooked neck
VAQAVAAVTKKMPKRIKRKRPITTTDGTPLGGMEEYYDYVFPEEAGVAPNLKLLEAAMRWKRQKLMGAEKEDEQQQQQQQQEEEPEQEQGQQQEEQGDGDDDDGY